MNANGVAIARRAGRGYARAGEGVRVGTGLVRALDGVELDVTAGETLAVMGPSGCGKSTLLHPLGGFERPSAGEVWLDRRRIDHTTPRRGAAGAGRAQRPGQASARCALGRRASAGSR